MKTLVLILGLAAAACGGKKAPATPSNSSGAMEMKQGAPMGGATYGGASYGGAGGTAADPCAAPADPCAAPH